MYNSENEREGESKEPNSITNLIFVGFFVQVLTITFAQTNNGTHINNPHPQQQQNTMDKHKRNKETKQQQ